MSGTQNATPFPPPSWGRVREGGIADHLPSGFPPPPTPPHQGEGNLLCGWPLLPPRPRGEGDLLHEWWPL